MNEYIYHVSSMLNVVMDDGNDAWVVGDEPIVVVDFQGMMDYARSL